MKYEDMNYNTKLEVAFDIISTMSAMALEKNDETLINTLQNEQKAMYEPNMEVIEKIIKVYGKMIKEGLV